MRDSYLHLALLNLQDYCFVFSCSLWVIFVSCFTLKTIFKTLHILCIFVPRFWCFVYSHINKRTQYENPVLKKRLVLSGMRIACFPSCTLLVFACHCNMMEIGNSVLLPGYKPTASKTEVWHRLLMLVLKLMKFLLFLNALIKQITSEIPWDQTFSQQNLRWKELH